MEMAATETSEPPIPDVDSQSLQDFEITSPSGLLATPTSNPAPPPHKNSGNKRKGLDTTEQLVGLATEYYKRSETEEDIVAKGWAMRLKKLSPDQRFAEKIINDTLFEAEMGTLTREGVRFVRPWTPSSSPSSSSTVSTNWQDYPNSAQPIYTSLPSPSLYQGQNQDNDTAAYFSSFTSM